MTTCYNPFCAEKATMEGQIQIQEKRLDDETQLATKKFKGCEDCMKKFATNITPIKPVGESSTTNTPVITETLGNFHFNIVSDTIAFGFTPMVKELKQYGYLQGDVEELVKDSKTSYEGDDVVRLVKVNIEGEPCTLCQVTIEDNPNGFDLNPKRKGSLPNWFAKVERIVCAVAELPKVIFTTWIRSTGGLKSDKISLRGLFLAVLTARRKGNNVEGSFLTLLQEKRMHWFSEVAQEYIKKIEKGPEQEQQEQEQVVEEQQEQQVEEQEQEQVRAEQDDMEVEQGPVEEQDKEVVVEEQEQDQDQVIMQSVEQEQEIIDVVESEKEDQGIEPEQDEAKDGAMEQELVFSTHVEYSNDMTVEMPGERDCRSPFMDSHETDNYTPAMKIQSLFRGYLVRKAGAKQNDMEVEQDPVEEKAKDGAKPRKSCLKRKHDGDEGNNKRVRFDVEAKDGAQLEQNVMEVHEAAQEQEAQDVSIDLFKNNGSIDKNIVWYAKNKEGKAFKLQVVKSRNLYRLWEEPHGIDADGKTKYLLQKTPKKKTISAVKKRLKKMNYKSPQKMPYHFTNETEEELKGFTLI